LARQPVVVGSIQLALDRQVALLKLAERGSVESLLVTLAGHVGRRQSSPRSLPESQRGAQRSRAGLRSVGASDVWAVSYDAFADQLRSEPVLVDAVLQALCSRVSDAEQRVKMLVHHDARERLARLLVHLAERRTDGHRTDIVGVSLTISHASLAAMAALSRPHVSLLMIEFRRRGLVSYHRGGPLRVNVERLLQGFNLGD
jgi:CRP-like cAMP-binding protein